MSQQFQGLSHQLWCFVPTLLMYCTTKRHLPSDAFLNRKMHNNAFLARPLPQTLMEQLTALPQFP